MAGRSGQALVLVHVLSKFLILSNLMAFLVGLDKHVRVMEGGRESNGPQKLSGWSCALNRASRLQKPSGHHPLMVRVQDFSINGLKESGHSPLCEACSSGGKGS